MKTFTSVWDAIEDSAEAAESMKARSAVMIRVQKVISGWDVAQSEAAKRLGITQPRLNDLVRGKIDKFSLDALLDLASRAGLRVSVAIKKAA
jgi:predicted XRE-type DNA-binding protein